MIKEHAELIAKKVQERRIDLSRMLSYPEYHVFKEELDKWVEKLDSIDNIDFSKDNVDIQARSNKLAKESIVRFLQDMNMYEAKKATVDNTYE